MNRAVLWLGLLLASACSTEIPDVRPEAFACTSDGPDEGAESACPETHWCVNETPGEPTGRCTPRFGCEDPEALRPGCTDGLFRCEPVFGGHSSAVRCESGVHTSTSVRPLDGECACPDGLHCVAFAETGLAGYPLFVLPRGARMPIGQLGVTGEIGDRRMCARACTSELDCSADHTCRPAAVVNGDLLADPSSRHTIAVCYPNRLVPTSTIVAFEQPDPTACRSAVECGMGPCQFRAEIVADHATVPAGPAWPRAHVAMISRCVGGRQDSLTEDGRACLESVQCRSGACFDGRCKTPCDPERPRCNTRCQSRELTRDVAGVTVYDHTFLCD